MEKWRNGRIEAAPSIPGFILCLASTPPLFHSFPTSLDNIDLMQYDCRKVMALLPGLPDGELPPEVLAAVDAHLDACPVCRAEAAAMRQLSAVLREEPLPGVELPSGVRVAAWVLEADAQPSRPWWRSLSLRWAAGGLAALGAAAVLVLVRPNLSPPRPRVPPAVQPVPEEALPTLVVVDDERTGRQVVLAPQPAPRTE